MDSGNRFGVVGHRYFVVIQDRFVTRPMSREEALNLAAHLFRAAAMEFGFERTQEVFLRLVAEVMPKEPHVI
jgi:hypothetical protein